jgi:hypothetical protein
VTLTAHDGLGRRVGRSGARYAESRRGSGVVLRVWL